MLSLIQKEPKTSTNFCILCAVREELTYICRVCLTKVYPLFSDREEFILCSCRQGSLSSVFRQGRLALRANFWFILCSFRQGRLALRANFWFILCSFRQGRLALRANFWFILCSFRQGRFWHYVLKTSVPSVDQRSVCFVCVVPKKLTKWSEGMLG